MQHDEHTSKTKPQNKGEAKSKPSPPPLRKPTTPNKTKPQNRGDATGFQDLGGGVRETENVRERREEPPQC